MGNADIAAAFEAQATRVGATVCRAAPASVVAAAIEILRQGECRTVALADALPQRTLFAKALGIAGYSEVPTSALRPTHRADAASDFSYVTYLSDIAVSREYQRAGIGRALIEATRLEAPRAKIVLLSAPAATDYYPHIGFSRHGSAWVLNPHDILAGSAHLEVAARVT